ncbi:MAG TPA: ferritin-like domain-containing protein [Burkholderiales bacterium]|jgi:ferritin-like protein|nr:ferritin-like domain-containing protein [Burkholderiales bacterium]
MASASATLHESPESLSKETVDLHRALVSLQEELEAADWYRQRADACGDPALKEILLHNMREEMEHASMVLEWIRRNCSDFAQHLRTYLFTDAPIIGIEEADTGKAAGDSGAGDAPEARLTIGSLKGDAA